MQRGLVWTGLSVFLLATAAQANFHYVHYTGRNAPFTPIFEKYNLAALPNNTLTFFVSDQGPSAFAANDSFGSVLSQIKQALAAWNAVPTSDLRVAFGGLEMYTPSPSVTAPGGSGLASTSPGADVIFVDLPPGLLGLSAPTTSPVAVNGPTGPFFPIVRGLVMLSRDTSRLQPGASYTESFFTTAVHEIGHALGLQHTWTGSAMSTAVIRNTSRTRPLDADDVAAISILYGKANWQANYGSISGRVAFANNTGVALASVVAIASNGPAVSTLTNPDGTYRIDGLPPSYNYMLYAHPLPPGSTDATALKLPVDANLQPFVPNGAFQTLFYPGTLDPSAATSIAVRGGSTVANVNFTVQARPAATTYDVVTYGWLDTASRTYTYTGDTEVTPAYINSNLPGFSQVICQPPVNMPVPRSATLLPGFNAVSGSIKAYNRNQPADAVVMYFDSLAGSGNGPRHLVLRFDNDIYVLPAAVTLVPKGPPVITSAATNGDGSVTVSGAGLGADSLVFFDGLQAAAQVPFSGTDAQGSLTVVPPQGGGGQTSTISVYNSDSQNTMILQSQTPRTYLYPFNGTPFVSNISFTALPAASSAAVDIFGVNTNFVDGQVTVGFGSNDVTVRRVWVLNPTHLIANVSVSPGATIGVSEISVISGLQVIPNAGMFQTQIARSGFPFIGLPIANSDATQQGIFPGSAVTVYGLNLVAPPAQVQLTLNDIPVPVQFANAGQINFTIPFGFPTGPAILRVNNGAMAAFPVVVAIGVPAPAITGVSPASNSTFAAGAFPSAVGAGDVLNIQASGLDPSVTENSGRLHVMVSGIDMPVQQILPLGNGGWQIQILLTQSFGGAQAPVTISVDGSSSAPFLISTK
jgi:uncharacterized protein (TIGR03437 family)